MMNHTEGLAAEATKWSDLTTDFSIDRVMVIDQNRAIVIWNRAAELASGLGKNEVIGKNLFEVFAYLQHDKEICHAIEEAFNGRKAFVGSNRSVAHRHYYENHFTPLLDSSGKVLGVMNIMHDVAHRIKVEDELRELNNSLADKYQQLENLTQELSNFTSITTQNIKEPLKYIYSSLELLIAQEGRNMADGSKASLRRMQVSLNRINWLIDDIVELFGLNSVERPRMQLNPLDLFEKAKQKLSRKIIELSGKISIGPLPTVTGNPELLVMLFENLLDNAIRFQPEGSKPVIEITGGKVMMDEHSHEPVAKGKAFIQISIKDNGLGIEPASHKRIFGMFEQLNDKKKFPGTGLGLAFAEKIMQHHGGYIKVESHPGEGSVFSCYFPVDHSLD